MDYYCITDFETTVNILCKKPKNGYSKCRADIKKKFNNKPFNELWNTPTKLNETVPIRIIKTRLPNSSLNVGKSAGYRIIYLINSETQTLTFLHVFPKIGKHGIENISDKELEKLLKKFLLEKSKKSLIKLDMSNYSL
ncbi:MAG: hypothetical protein IMY72_02115 [Bacteroidetes bacterium]|nr:hypothetical protein [Bacteroidota bacterium]